jgi:HlyD family secretion protein
VTGGTVDERTPPETGKTVTTPPAKRRRAGFWAVALLLIAATGAAGWWYWPDSAPPVRYSTAPATTGSVTRSIVSTGTVNPELTIIVGTYVSGVIQQLNCDYNTEVKKGQICAKIDPRPYQTAVDQSKANLSIARAQLEKDKAALAYAKQAFDRTERLVQTNAVSRDAYDSAHNVYDQAQAQIQFDEATIQHRQAALAAAQVNLDYTDIVSPVDGTVVSRNVTMGQTVAASFQTPTLFLIATDLTRMQVDANVSESDIGGIKPGNRASFTVDAFPKRVFRATVTQVRQSPQTVQNVVTYDVVLSVDNSDLALLPGMTAAARIITAQRREVIRVPNQALRFSPTGAGPPDPEQPQVWALRDESLVAVTVETGLQDDNFTEIASGELKPGDRVILSDRPGAAAATRARPNNAPRLRL